MLLISRVVNGVIRNSYKIRQKKLMIIMSIVSIDETIDKFHAPIFAPAYFVTRSLDRSRLKGDTLLARMFISGIG